MLNLNIRGLSDFIRALAGGTTNPINVADRSHLPNDAPSVRPVTATGHSGPPPVSAFPSTHANAPGGHSAMDWLQASMGHQQGGNAAGSMFSGFIPFVANFTRSAFTPRDPGMGKEMERAYASAEKSHEKRVTQLQGFGVPLNNDLIRQLESQRNADRESVGQRFQGMQQYNQMVGRGSGPSGDFLTEWRTKLKALESMPAIGIVGKVLGKLTDFIRTADRIGSRSISVAGDLSQYNGAIAGSLTQLEADRIRRSIQQGSAMAPHIDKVTKQRSKFEQATQDLSQPYKQIGAEISAFALRVSTWATNLLNKIDVIGMAIEKWLGKEEEKDMRTVTEKMASNYQSRYRQLNARIGDL